MSAALDYSTRTIKIYSGAYDPTARAAIAEHLTDAANPHGVTKAQVGLGDVDNTSDAAKPISTAQAAALALKAPLASPALTGVPTAPTAAPGTVTTQLATTAFTQAAANAAVAPVADAAADLAAHEADTTNPHSVTKAQVGLGAVDNTADANKPVSGPQQAALNATNDNLVTVAGDLDLHEANSSNPHGVTKAQVGLGNADNTADFDKPISTATQTALNAANASTAAVAADLAEHETEFANPHGVTKAQVGLGAVDNTADLDKPVSTATQAAINAANSATSGVATDLAAHLADTGNPHQVDKADVGLGSADNTADLAKPVSTATQIALNTKAPIASPALTGIPTAPTAAIDTATGQIATTQFVQTAVAGSAADIDAAAAAAAAAQADADAAQADATQALADAAAAQADADAAQTDATAALAAGGPVPSLVAQLPARPGDAVGLYGAGKVGGPADIAPLDNAWVAVSAAGSVLHVDAAAAADPQTVAPLAVVAMEVSRTYEIRYRVQRRTDPADPVNDSVTLGIRWLANNKAGIADPAGTVTVENIPLTVADGVQERRVRVALTTGYGEYIAPAGTVYCRPFIDLFGDSHVTDVIMIAMRDISDLINPPLLTLHLPKLAADPAVGPGVGLAALYVVDAGGTGTATLRMQAGTDPTPIDLAVNVGSGF